MRKLWQDNWRIILASLKGQCHKISDLWFFSWISFPKPLSTSLGPFRIFSKILRDIRSSRCTTGVVDTGCRRYCWDWWQNLPPVLLIPEWCTLTCKYLREFSKKFETVLIRFSHCALTISSSELTILPRSDSSSKQPASSVFFFPPLLGRRLKAGCTGRGVRRYAESALFYTYPLPSAHLKRQYSIIAHKRS